MITLAKSLGGGVPVSAVLVDDAVAATVEPGDQGSTFGGGMLAMAAVEAVLETIEADDLMARAGAIHRQVRAAAAPHAAEVRGKGCLIGLRFERPVAPIVDALREHGVLVGGSADPEVMRLMPPLTATDADVAEFADALAAACAAPVSG
jgi:acetylornithine aminotransferase/acetylornithine/N-succinyldiaminopimelate aminotransferase